MGKRLRERPGGQNEFPGVLAYPVLADQILELPPRFSLERRRGLARRRRLPLGVEDELSPAPRPLEAPREGVPLIARETRRDPLDRLRRLDHAEQLAARRARRRNDFRCLRRTCAAVGVRIRHTSVRIRNTPGRDRRTCAGEVRRRLGLRLRKRQRRTCAARGAARSLYRAVRMNPSGHFVFEGSCAMAKMPAEDATSMIPGWRYAK